MKKLLLTIIVVFIASCSFGQNISGGLKAGLNLADQKFSGDGVTVGHKLKPGLHAGLFFIVMVNDKFAIQPEVLFSMQGSKLDFDLFDNEYVTSFNYLAVPILARYNFTERFSAHVGPQIGFLMSAEIESSGGGQSTVEDVKEDYKTVDIGAALGAEVEIVGGLGAGLRYVFGLTDIYDADTDTKVKNSNVQIYLKYKLFGNKK